MSHWNVRLTVRAVDGEEIWEPREIFYDDDGKVSGWTQDAVAPMGQSWREVTDEIARMVSVVTQPAFDLDKRQWREPGLKNEVIEEKHERSGEAN